MISETLHRQRRRAGVGIFIAGSIAVVWMLSPGLPVWFGPWATAKTKQAGKNLFVHEWKPNDPLAHGDGLGPVYNATSCVACHSQGGVGGGGDKTHDVVAFEVHPTKQDPEVHRGVVHKHAIQASLEETRDHVQALFPKVHRPPRRGYAGCGGPVEIADFDRVRYDTLNTPALFGAGWIDRISDKSILHNRMKRTLANTPSDFDPSTEALPVGRPSLLPGGGVGKFGWKAQFGSLHDFVAQACANEIGLGTPYLDQATPLSQRNYPAPKKPDLDRKQFAALVAFVDTLPRPVEVSSADAPGRQQAAHGKELFGSIGCASCHTPDLGGVQGVYSDFLLYKVDLPRKGGSTYDQQDQTDIPPFPDRIAQPEEWKTPPLWGVADSAPYFHDGGCPTLESAIMRHGGDAESITRKFGHLPREDQEAVVAFLQTLRAPPDASPVPATEVQNASR